MTKPKSDGQRRLIACGAEGTEIARVCETTKQTVSRWKLGQRKPEPAQRRALEIAYGIPVGSWDVKPGMYVAKKKATTKTKSEISEPSSPVTTRARTVTDRIAQLESVLESVTAKRKTDNLAAGELARLVSSEGGIIERIARLEDRQKTEEQSRDARLVLEHPTWHQLRAAILGALKSDKEAARKVLEAISKIEAA